MMDVSGQVVPMTVAQFMNYTVTTQRTVPESVQELIDDITDPAESKLTTPPCVPLRPGRANCPMYLMAIVPQLQSPSLVCQHYI